MILTFHETEVEKFPVTHAPKDTWTHITAGQ